MRLRSKTPTCFVTSENGDTLLHILVRESTSTDIKLFKEAVGNNLFQPMVKITNDNGEIIYDLIFNKDTINSVDNNTSLDKLLYREKERSEIFNLLLNDFLQNDLKTNGTFIKFEEIVKFYNIDTKSHLYYLVEHACEVVNSVKNQIKKSSTHPEWNGLYDEVMALQKKIDTARQKTEVNKKAISSSTKDFDSYLKNRIKDFVEEEIGNCEEQCYCALSHAKYPLEFFVLDNGDHFFIIFNSDNCYVVCDPWAGRVYPRYAAAEQLCAHRGFYYPKDGQAMYANIVTSFNPNFHNIKTVNLFNERFGSIARMPGHIGFNIFGTTEKDLISSAFSEQYRIPFQVELADGLKRNDIVFIVFLLLTSYGRNLLIQFDLTTLVKEDHLRMLLPSGVSVISFLAASDEGKKFLFSRAEWMSIILRNNIIPDHIPNISLPFSFQMPSVCEIPSAMHAVINVDNFEMVRKPNTDSIFIRIIAGGSCRIFPGIVFEVLSYARDSNSPGYVKPVGQGQCDVICQTGEAIIKVTSNPNKNESRGFYENGKRIQIGPFIETNIKSKNLTHIINFDYEKNFQELIQESDHVANDYNLHTLSILGKEIEYFVIDFRPNIPDIFSNKQKWEEVYNQEFLINGKEMSFTASFIQEAERFDASSLIPQGSQISVLMCRTNLENNKTGSKIILSDTRAVSITLKNPESDCTLFNIPGCIYLMIPREPKGKVIMFNLQSNLFNKNGYNITGYCGKPTIHFNSPAGPSLFSQNHKAQAPREQTQTINIFSSRHSAGM